MGQQEINGQRVFRYAYIAISIAVFILVAMRCATIPFCHDETATFFYFIQPGDFWPYHAHIDTNNHVLNSCLSWLCYKAFGDSPFSLRLPNLLALLILILATFRISKQLKQTHAKLILMAGFLVSFHWLSFYSMCRGYGLSMSFLILSISYLIEYFNSKKIKSLTLFYLFIQLAISANMILLFTTIIITFAVLVFQLLNKELLKKWNIPITLAHLLLLLFWVKFSFFLQANFLQPNQSIFAAASAGYWKITFVTLIELLSGYTNHLIPALVGISFLVLVVTSISISFKKTKTNFQYVFHPALFFTLILIALIAAFYVMKVFLNVSYPEDRMGLFFYVFFILSIVFTSEQFTGIPVKVFAGLILSGAFVHFILNLNFRKHSQDSYETMPERFYSRLIEEQKANNEKITIAGQTETEFIYDFMNYRHNGALTLIDVSPDGMPMNSDYVIAWGKKEPYYETYYTKIDSEKDWGLSLLKRRDKIKRNLLISDDSIHPVQGHAEFYNLLVLNDTSFKNTNPLLVEFNIGSIQAEMPLQSWLVLQIDSSEGHSVYYERIPLNWVKYDWTTPNNQPLFLTSGKLPTKIYKLTCYLWNIEKKEIELKMNSIKIYQLEAKDINAVAHFHPPGKP